MTDPHNDRDAFSAEVRAIAARMPADVLDALRAAHDRLSWGCAARDCGQPCCLADLMLDQDPEGTTP